MPATLLSSQDCHEKQIMDDKGYDSTLETKKCYVSYHIHVNCYDQLSASQNQRGHLYYTVSCLRI